MGRRHGKGRGGTPARHAHPHPSEQPLPSAAAPFSCRPHTPPPTPPLERLQVARALGVAPPADQGALVSQRRSRDLGAGCEGVGVSGRGTGGGAGGGGACPWPDLRLPGSAALASQHSAAHLRQRLLRVLCVHVAQDHAQAEGALQLADAMVDVLRLQQVVPETGGQGLVTLSCSPPARAAAEGGLSVRRSVPACLPVHPCSQRPRPRKQCRRGLGSAHLRLRKSTAASFPTK